MIHRVHPFRRVFLFVAALCLILSAARADRVVAQSSGCPCSIWTPAATPANPALTDGQPIEVGVKFRSDVNGFVTALRFYKGTANIGSHVGHLWSGTGALLAEATFTNESAAGWQEIALTPPVAITANTTYVASYHADSGFFAFDSGFFSAGRRRLAAAARAGRRRRRPQRRLSLRRERLSLGRKREQLLGRCRVSNRPGARHDAPRCAQRDACADRDGRSSRDDRQSGVQRGDRSVEPYVIHVRPARPGERRDPGGGQLRRRHPHGDPGHHRWTAGANHVHRHPERRRQRRERSRGQRARIRLYLVVHDRRARAAARRGSGRADPGHLQLVEPVRPLLRRDPARRRPERVHRHRYLAGHACDARGVRRRDSRRDAADVQPGGDAHRLGVERRQPDCHASRQTARRSARA